LKFGSRFTILLLCASVSIPSFMPGNQDALAADNSDTGETRSISVDVNPAASSAKPLPSPIKLIPAKPSTDAKASAAEPVQPKPEPKPEPKKPAAPAAAPAYRPGAASTARDTDTEADYEEPEAGLLSSDEDKGPSPSDFLKDDNASVITDSSGNAVEAGTDQMVGETPHDFLGAVEKSIKYFSISVKEHFSRYLFRSGRYMGLMRSILRENYLPEDLVFLALIESGFNPKAYSFAAASGPWQFIRGTAVRYGLKVDRYVDERRDPIKSTRAAAAYLNDLYKMFGSWPLALASYNCGEGNVARAVSRRGTEDFWELRKSRSLPTETMEYVPKFLAAKLIANDPKKYGFENVQYDTPFQFEEVVLDRCTDIDLVAKCCEVPVQDIKDLNPELIRGCTPPYLPNYNIRIPKGTKEKFLKAYAALSDEEKTARPRTVENKSKRYVVKKGDTLKSVARKFDLTVAELAGRNNLRLSSRLRKGQRIVIPGIGGQDSGGSVRTVSAKSVASPAEKPSSYTVKKGDSLARIAKKNGLSVKQLASLNGIAVKTKVRSGQKLKLAGGGSDATQPDDNSNKLVQKVSVSGGKKTSKSKTASKASKQSYTVKTGDTIYSISKKYGISTDALMKANGMGKPKIKKGQNLVIPEAA
jgi:membrane-bound lytic murein transglycosylase D